VSLNITHLLYSFSFKKGGGVFLLLVSLSFCEVLTPKFFSISDESSDESSGLRLFGYVLDIRVSSLYV